MIGHLDVLVREMPLNHRRQWQEVNVEEDIIVRLGQLYDKDKDRER